MAVTMSVEGSPKRIWVQKESVYPEGGARRACSQTIRFAADPSSERFPATVLTHANISHDLFSSLGDMDAAEAATRAPSKRTAKPIAFKHHAISCTTKKICYS